MPELRSGTVTFVFTDIEGSTRLARSLKDRWPDVRSAHRRIVRAAFAAHGGEEVDTQGDSFFYVFARARDGALAAAEADRALAVHDWPEEGQVRIRIGMHTGEPVVSEEGYHGTGLHRAARIMAVGHGGQVLMSEATAAVLADEEVPGVGVRDLGRHQLKDLNRSEHVFQLVSEGLDQQFPRIRTAAVRPLYRRPLVIGATAGVLAAAVAIPIFALAGGSGGGAALASVDDNAVGVVDAGSRTLNAQATGIEAPQGVTSGAGAIWVSSGNGTVAKIDPQNYAVEQTVAVGNTPTGVAVGDGSVWVTNAGDGTVTQLDAASGKVKRTIDVHAPVHGIAFGGGSLWISDPVGNAVIRVPVDSPSASTTIGVGSGPSAIAYGGGQVWVANNLDGTVSRIDPAGNVVTGTFPVGAAPNGIAVTQDAVWVSDEVDGTLVRVDPKTGATTPTTLGGRPEGVGLASGSVWVAVQPAGAAHHGGDLRLVTPVLDFIDPALSYNQSIWQVLAVTSDGLVGFKRVGGVDGNTLVPDLATRLPRPTNGGRTYSFQLRDGVRFSTGKEVTPADVRATFERLFHVYTPGAKKHRMPSPRLDFYEGIVGGRACAAHPASCDLSRGIVTNDADRTVTFHLETPDPEFLYKLAVPFAYTVPRGTVVGRDRPTVGTGPYRIETYTPHRHAHLVRNPHFRVWSRAAQPEGLPDTIDLSTTLARGKKKPASARAAFLAAAAGRVDVPEAGVPEDLLETARTRYPAQLHVTPSAETNYVVLNLHRLPFNSALAREALAFALDRAHMLGNAGGSDLAKTTCQLLPPGLPGYKPYCPFTVRPGTGTWTAPDLQRAHELVARSGTRGAHVHVITTDQTRDFGKHDLEVAATLRKLGYQVSVKHYPTDAEYFATLYSKGNSFDAAVSGWAQDYPAPSNFFSALSCTNSASTCNPALDRQIAGVSAASTASGSNDGWTTLDRSVTDRAFIIPFINLKATDFVSKRLENYQHHPEFGLLIDQVWLQ